MSEDREGRALNWAKRANRLMKKAPPGVWLFSNNGTLEVMLVDEGGSEGDHNTSSQIMDLDITNDGGDP